ncbi:MAG: radical SAM protein, partial [Candidatus Asgardarchaeum californiense]
NAFAYTGDIEKDILSIASVHPIREEGMKELLKKSESNWGVVEKLIHDNKLVETGYKNKRFYMRKIVGRDN